MPASPSSFWKLGVMIFVIMLCVLTLVWTLTSGSLRRTFDQTAQLILEDDLGEYAEIYQQAGPKVLDTLFAAGSHEHDHLFRVNAPDGSVLFSRNSADLQEITWPELPDRSGLRPGETAWLRHPLPRGGVLTIGQTRLPDGTIFSFGRTGAGDLEALQRVHRGLTLAIAVAAVLATGPSIWFGLRVLRPLRTLTDGASHLAREDSGLRRLEIPPAIPELQDFAVAFNLGLDRIQRLTEELEAANDQLAHELRTPMARIRGNVEPLLTVREERAIHEAAVLSLAEIDRATQLIQSILTIRAGDSRVLRLNRSPVCIAQLATETCDLYAAAAEAKGLVLHRDIVPPPGTAVVDADRARLQQALCNLLDNALAYTPKGGEVSVAVSVAPTNGEILLQVLDTGPGLTEADLESIWGRFTRGSAASAANPGIGLGLSLVHAIVEAHGGQTGAANRLDRRGAGFWIRLPTA